MKYLLIYLLFAVLLLNECRKRQTPPAVQLFEIRVILFEGDARKASPQVPLFPGELSIQFLESSLSDIDSLRAEIEKTFRFSFLNYRDLLDFFVVPQFGDQLLVFPLGEKYHLQLLIFSQRANGKLPLQIKLQKLNDLQKSKENSEPLVFTRVDIPFDQSMVFGRVIDKQGQKAIFLVIKPILHRVAQRDSLLEMLKGIPNIHNIPDQKKLKRFMEEVEAQYSIPQDSLLKLWNIPMPDTTIYDFRSLTERPRLIQRAMPEYPEVALKARIEGRVILRILINEKGDVIATNLLKSSGNAALDSSAIAAARKFKFTPAKVNGKAVKTRLTIPFDFRLHK